MEFDLGTEDKAAGDFEEMPPGDYSFKVDVVEEKKFRSGNKGVGLKLLAFIGDRDVVIFDNLVAKENCIWKWQQLAKALGLPVSGKIDPMSFEGRIGMAAFVRPSDSKYLQVDKYHPLSDPPAPAITAPTTGDVPF